MAIAQTGADLGNHLLDVLSERETGLLYPHLTRVPLPKGQVLYEPGDEVSHVYFPCDGVVSLVCVSPEGEDVEVGLIGHEGAVGLVASQGARLSFPRAIVQLTGQAYVIDALRLQSLAGAAMHEFQGLTTRYVEALLGQVMQLAACNATHGLQARLGRWLLMCLDRVSTSRLPLTQEFLGEMLAVQRTSVNAAIRKLEERQTIACRRGVIEVVSRESLEQVSCGCYGLIRQNYDRLLPGKKPLESVMVPPGA